MLPKNFRLRKNKDFRIIYRSGKSLSNPFLVLYKKSNHLKESRIGFSISKKIGKANERNLLKRQLREIIKRQIYSIKKGYDLVFIARLKIKGISYKDLEDGIKSLLVRGKMLNGK